jgi:hypothetical protein
MFTTEKFSGRPGKCSKQPLFWCRSYALRLGFPPRFGKLADVFIRGQSQRKKGSPALDKKRQVREYNIIRGRMWGIRRQGINMIEKNDNMKAKDFIP